MPEDLPKPISTWLSRIQDQSKRFEETAATVSGTIDLVEATLQAVGGLGEVVRWFPDSSHAPGFGDFVHHGLQIGEVNGRSAIFYARGILRDDKVITNGSWVVLRSCDINTQSIAIQFLPEFLRFIHTDFEERTNRLAARLSKITKTDAGIPSVVHSRPGLLSLLATAEAQSEGADDTPAENGEDSTEQSPATDMAQKVIPPLLS